MKYEQESKIKRVRIVVKNDKYRGEWIGTYYRVFEEIDRKREERKLVKIREYWKWELGITLALEIRTGEYYRKAFGIHWSVGER